MENGALILGLEDGTIDVECLLVEPQDERVSMDNVLCFRDKILENAMDVEEVTHSFGCSTAGFARRTEDILYEEVFDAVRGEIGYFQLQNDFSGVREEYLLGVEFAESITNLDYVGSSDGPNLASSGAETSWESDLSRIMEAPNYRNSKLNVDSPELNDFPSHHGSESLAEGKILKSHTSCTLSNIGKFEDISRYSFPDILCDEDDRSLFPSDEMPGITKIVKNDEYDIATQGNENERFEGQDVSATASAEVSSNDALPPQKRSRKPTQRYIDELADNISTYPKKRREASSPSVKKCQGAKDVKKFRMGSKATKAPAEESSVIAIQVPFASLIQKESQKSHACDTVHGSDANLTTRSKDNRLPSENLKKRNEGITSVHQRKREDFVVATSLKKKDDCIMETHSKKRDNHHPAPSPKKRDCIITLSPKKRDHRVTAMNREKSDEYLTAAHHKEKDEYASVESSELVTGRRKHHRLWSITEVRKLIDGISQYGVGRWSHIKKIFFSASPHRTSVDLKDKWRNLLKASGMQEQGEKKRNPAWRPLPKSILRRVCELAAMHPYPKGRKPKLGHHCRDSPDRGTGITE